MPDAAAVGFNTRFVHHSKSLLICQRCFQVQNEKNKVIMDEYPPLVLIGVFKDRFPVRHKINTLVFFTSCPNTIKKKMFRAQISQHSLITMSVTTDARGHITDTVLLYISRSGGVEEGIVQYTLSYLAIKRKTGQRIMFRRWGSCCVG